ncbi:MAG TPA: 50S ribosomal protein L2 [Candidatus Saccharimonadales bacterium]|nr:50S ribosomal protein L2 [Candidatus Saccharimonadales bacterium]
MSIKKLSGSTPSRRFMTTTKENISKKRPEKRLSSSLGKTGGRDSAGHVSVRHIGGRHKRLYRSIDFKRDKFDVVGRVAAIEYDPNRTSLIALIHYSDGDKRYILAPLGLEVGHEVVSGQKVEVKMGNSMPLKNIPVGSVVHNVEMTPGRGGILARGAGGAVTLMAKESGWAQLRLPSTEIRKVNADCMATIGSLGNIDQKNITLGKAGRSRRMGIRPTVRGVAMNPSSHPHGGGEGRSGIGMSSPKTPWGKHAFGKTRKKKQSDKYIVSRRKK